MLQLHKRARFRAVKPVTCRLSTHHFCGSAKWNSSEHGFDMDLYANSACPSRDPKNLERDRLQLASIISRAMRDRLDRFETIEQTQQRPLTIIDVGCGDGLMSLESCEKALNSNPDFPVDQLDLRLYDPFPPLPKPRNIQHNEQQNQSITMEMPTVLPYDAVHATTLHEPGSVDIFFSRNAIHLLSVDELRDRLLPSVSRILSNQGGCMATMILNPKGTLLWPLSLQQRWQEHVKVFDPPNHGNEWNWNPSDDFKAERMDGVGRVIIPDGLFSHLSHIESEFPVERSKQEWCHYLRMKPNSFMIPLSDEFIQECCDWISNNIHKDPIPMCMVSSLYLFHK